MSCVKAVMADKVQEPGKMQQQKSIIEIYTDWANHYLEKTRGKRKISDLQAEVCDGLILSEVIEVVTNQKVPDINKKPKNSAQMVGNIQACLNFLIAKRVAVEEINAQDINEGNLKAILGLFFQLSRYKQQQKQLSGNAGSSGKTNIATPGSPAKNTNIPMPASHLQSPKRSLDPNKRGDQTSGIRSFLPGKSCNVTSSGGNKQNIQSGVIKPPAARHTKVMQSQGVQSSIPQQESVGKQSMLDRFKLGKSSPITNSPIKRGLGKRTSSSSGFSSARSDRSESSISLSSDTNFPSPSALRRIQETQHGGQSSGDHQQSPGSRAGVRSKLGRSPVQAHADKQSSPKRSPKLGRSSGVTAIKDYGMIDERQGGEKQARPLNYPPHAYSTCRNGVQLKHTNISSAVTNGKAEPPESRIPNPCDSKTKPPLSSTGIPSPRGRPPPAPPVRTVTDPSKSAECKSAEAQMVRNVQSNGPSCGKPQLSESGERGRSDDKIGEQSGIPASVNPLQNNETEETQKKIPQPHCSQTETEAPATSIENKPEPSLSTSFHSRTCSLPRQKRLGDSSPSPNVAIVSPMPSLTRSQTMSAERESSSNVGNSLVSRDKLPVGPIKGPDSPQKKEELEDPLQGIAPMAPLGLFAGRTSHGQVPRMHFSRIRKSQEFPPNVQTVNAALLSGGDGDQLCKRDGYCTDVGLASGYLSDGDAITRTNTHGHVDGYMSEGGAEFYTNKIQARIAYEKQRSEGEAKHHNYVAARESGNSSQSRQQRGQHQPHQPLPEVLRPLNKSASPSMAPPAIYRVVGGRKNVQKADSGIQTETSAQHQLAQQQEQWRAAMEHNKQVLTNQEQAMEEYLRRQCKEAEKHIQRQSPMMGRRHGSSSRNTPQPPGHINQHPSRNGIASMPGTPTGSRRSSVQGSASANYRYLQQNGPNGPSGNRGMVQMADTGIDGQRRQQDPSVPWVDMARQIPRGGSLERQQHKYNPAMVHVAYSDNEHYRSGKQNTKSHSPVVQSENEKMQRNSRQNAINSSKSLPKGTSALNYGLLMGQIQQKRQQRQNKCTDGSVSDSNYATYQEIQGLRGGSSSPYQWLQPANTYGGRTRNQEDSMGSNESLNSISSSIQQARANSLTKANLMEHQKQTRQIVSHNSFSRGSPSTSTKSDIKYGIKQEETEYYGVPFILRNDQKGKISQFKSQPTSPTSDVSSRPEMSNASMSSGPNSLNYSSLPSYGSSAKQRHKKSSLEPREDLNGSNLSLVSTGSSVYSNQDDKTNSDIQKLRWELAEEHEKVLNLTSQLSTNAHVVSAFEQSLGNMTSRLQEITRTAERKDTELLELRHTIEKLRQSGVDAGLVKHEPQPNQLLRQMSTDSVASMSSNHSNSSLNSGDERERGKKNSTGPKRSGWLRTSFSKAFSKSKMKHKGGSVSDVEDGSITKMMDNLEVGSDHSDDHPLFPQPLDANSVKTSQSSSDLHKNEEEGIDPQVVNELKRQLIEKDCLLTETRLEALSSAHQLESLRETVTKMKTELMSLKQDNDKLASHVVSKSLGSSVTSLNTTTESEIEKRLSMTISESSHMSVPSTLDLSGTTDPSNQDNKPVSVTVVLSEASVETHVKIGTIAASCKLSWQLLDSLIERLFKEYIMLVDPVASLGLTSDSIQCYVVGEVRRKIQQQTPELLPYGYLIGDVDSIKIMLRNASDCGGVDALAFETLTPNSIIQRYVSLLQEHKRVILCGPSGTGKTYMAAKLADFLVRKFRATGRMTHVQTFALCRNNQETFNNFLDKVSVDSGAGHPDTPSVIILDNLHHIPHLDQVLEDHLTASLDTSPYIIGTMNQTTNTTTNLQLRHNFRWILCASHIEPVRGYLGRQLRQRLLMIEVETRTHNGELTKVLDFIVKAQIIINKFLESHCSPDSTISSRLFLTCPMEVSASRSWFINLWNHTIVPHILDQVREGLELYGRRASWEDPLSLMMELWPWNVEPETGLLQVLPEHVGYDIKSPLQEEPRPMSGSHSMDGQNDPLFNMLVTLQEAANVHTGDL